MLKLDVVLPGLNEEAGLENTIRTLSTFMRENMREYQWRIVIADNGSTDATPEIWRRLALERGRVEYLRLEQRGRGRALKHAWMQSDADIVSYMDMDLSTDLTYLPTLVSSVANEGHDVAIGSRLKRGAQGIGR
ncbi:MAG: glycosyltransferase [Dehalococcoidia bacterium]|nr:glycosyltransferase [Dehalococcoidia bacterium]